MTTSVVAYTSFWLGQVTRPISLRTSERKRRDRPHHPVTLSRARPPIESSVSIVAVLLIVWRSGPPRRGGALRPLTWFLLAIPASFATARVPWRWRLARIGRTGGNRTPNPRFW